MSDDEVADEMVSLCEGSMQSVEKLLIEDVTKLDVLNDDEENVVNKDEAEVVDLGNLKLPLVIIQEGTMSHRDLKMQSLWWQ